MKKEKKKRSKKFKIIVTTVVLSCLALIATGLGFWFGFSDPSLSKEVKSNPFHSSWMSYLKDDAKITEVVMPGSHDAGTNHMMPQALCQGHDIIDQLNGGVRYFDLRVTKKGDDLVMFHGPIKGQKFSKVLSEYQAFIASHPSEFLVLDFQHFGEEAQKPTADMLKEFLPMDKMLEADKYPNLKEVDMKLIREQKLNFVVIFSGDEKVVTSGNFYPRDQYLLSEYDGDIHKESDEALIKQFDIYYSHADDNKFFVLQAQRTAKTLLGKPSIYEKGFAPKVNEFIKGLKNNPDYLSKTNIIMRDFIVSDINKVNTILELNISKGLVKSSEVNNFSSFLK